ncbi:MAG: FtsX-like permease family protein, partial [Vicinamibacterales bacterium]
ADGVPLVEACSRDPDRSVRSLSEALQRAEPELTFDVTSMSRRLSQQVARERSVAYLTSVFAGLALVLASVGLYGVLAYVVAHRNREIGVRMALGARRSEVVALVFRESAVLASIGLTVGLAAAPLATRSLQNMFFEVRTLDTLTVLSVAGIMLFVALLATIIPARRATRVDPIVALRCE